MNRPGRILTRTGRFVRDEAGAVLVLWIMSLVAVIAFVALVFDMGRVQVTHGELQSFADSVALAAAGELDGRADAIARATAAAAEIADSNVYGGDGTLSGAGDYTLTFLTGLPASDTAAITNGYFLESPYDSADDAAARLVRVQVTPVSNNMNFLAATRALFGSAGGDTMATRAEAIAGFTMEACDITPLMFCVPNAGWRAKANIGQNIRLRTGGNGASWLPGAFGFLDISAAARGAACAGASGTKELITCMIGAESKRTQCYAQNAVKVEPGQKTGIQNDAYNIRFDLISSDLKDLKDDPNYTAAPNIISGRVRKKNDACVFDNPDPTSPDTVALPHDDCFYDVAGCTPYARFGNKTWDYDSYIDTNYGDKDPNTPYDPDTEDPIADYIPAKYAGTRYGVYLGEILYAKAQNGGVAGGDILTDRAETGYPQCGIASTDPERRVLIAAAIDCSSFEDDTSDTDKNNLPVIEFVELFMMEPVGEGTGTGSAKSFDMWVEVIGSAGERGYGGAGDGGKFRDVVQLYR